MPSPLMGGIGVRLTAASPDALADLELVLGLATRSTQPPELTLHAAPATLSRPARPPDRAAQHMEFWTDSNTDVVCTLGRHLAVVGDDWAILDPGMDGVGGLHTVLFPVLSLLFARRGECVVHAGAFLDESWGGAVLGLGGSGQGKSTLITAALSAGQSVLSDDLVVARLDDAGTLAVSGVPQPLALPADIAGDGPTIGGDRRGRRHPGQPVRLDPGWHRVCSVVLVGHSNQAQGQLVPAEPRDVFHRLLTSTVEGSLPEMARHAFPFAAAAGRLPGWRLGHADDASVRIAAARRWLALARASAVSE